MRNVGRAIRVSGSQVGRRLEFRSYHELRHRFKDNHLYTNLVVEHRWCSSHYYLVILIPHNVFIRCAPNQRKHHCGAVLYTNLAVEHHWCSSYCGRAPLVLFVLLYLVILTFLSDARPTNGNTNAGPSDFYSTPYVLKKISTGKTKKENIVIFFIT